MAQAPIVIKRKIVHGGHHGGAWKVAYADFVTAMMALFIVLWMLNTSAQLQEAIGGYFKDPTGTSKKVGTALMGSGENFMLSKDNMPKLKEQLQKAMLHSMHFEKLKKQIEMTVTSEGLRIELLEGATGTFFDQGDASPSGAGRDILINLAHELGKLPNRMAIEGHTDSAKFANKDYGNWELSTDRANAARRLMQENGLRADQITQVRGYADQRLRKPDNPMDPSNRRITLIISYQPKEAPEPPETPEQPEKAEKPAK